MQRATKPTRRTSLGPKAVVHPADRAAIALEDGTVLYGRSCGAPGETSGEIVFNTSMAGYQIGRAHV